MTLPSVISNEELDQYLIKSVRLIEQVYREDVKESVRPMQFAWYFNRSGLAEVVYEVHEPIHIDFNCSSNEVFKRNFMNSLFTNKSIALLRRMPSDGNNNRSGSFSPVYVRIATAVYEEHRTLLVFRVESNYLIQLWKLKDARELAEGIYKLEPCDLLSHLRPFVNKLTDHDNYVLSRMGESKVKAKIIGAILPVSNEVFGKSTKVAITEEVEDEMDAELPDGNYSTVQLNAIRDIVDKQEPLVMVDGGCRMGKSELVSVIIPGLLSKAIAANPTKMCLALVGSNQRSLACLFQKVKEKVQFETVSKNPSIRILNLLDFGNQTRCVTNSVAEMIGEIMKYQDDFMLSKEEKDILEKARECFYSQLLPMYHSAATSSNNRPKARTSASSNPSTNQVNNKIEVITIEDGEVTSDVEDETNSIGGISLDDGDEDILLMPAKDAPGTESITSAELDVLQQAMKVIFKYYHPNCILAKNETLVSLMPVLEDHLTHVVVDDAGLSTMIDILAMVTESKVLRQLVLVGDSGHSPSNRRIRAEKLPVCFLSVMNAVNRDSPILTHHMLRKTFKLHGGIAHLLDQVFYSDRNVSPMVEPKPVKFSEFKNPDFPVAFFEMVGEDTLVFPTTRMNWQQTELALNLLRKLRETNQNLRVTILCYYDGQKKNVIASLRRSGIRNVEVATVDAFYNRSTDFVILITTRCREEIVRKSRFTTVFKNGRVYLHRVPLAIHELSAIRKADSFNFVFNKQRLLTALSRGERGCFIIGSVELLRECTVWNNLVNMVMDNDHFAEEPPLPVEAVAPKAVLSHAMKRSFPRVSRCVSPARSSESDNYSSYRSHKRPRFENY